MVDDRLDGENLRLFQVEAHDGADAVRHHLHHYLQNANILIDVIFQGRYTTLYLFANDISKVLTANN